MPSASTSLLHYCTTVQVAFGVYLEALGIVALLTLVMIAVAVWGARYIMHKFINNPILLDGESCKAILHYTILHY